MSLSLYNVYNAYSIKQQVYNQTKPKPKQKQERIPLRGGNTIQDKARWDEAKMKRKIKNNYYVNNIMSLKTRQQVSARPFVVAQRELQEDDAPRPRRGIRS